MPARPGEPAERIVVRGCDFVARYVYDVPNHMWYEPAGAGLMRLGMTCVAEGIDHEAQAHLTRVACCDLLQGWL